jgi:hypothetical protein
MDGRPHTIEDSIVNLHALACTPVFKGTGWRISQHSHFIQFYFYFLRQISNHEHQEINLIFSFFLSVHIKEVPPLHCL